MFRDFRDDPVLDRSKDACFAVAIGMCAAPMWPLFLPAALIYHFVISDQEVRLDL